MEKKENGTGRRPFIVNGINGTGIVQVEVRFCDKDKVGLCVELSHKPVVRLDRTNFLFEAQQARDAWERARDKTRNNGGVTGSKDRPMVNVVYTHNNERGVIALNAHDIIRGLCGPAEG